MTSARDMLVDRLSNGGENQRTKRFFEMICPELADGKLERLAQPGSAVLILLVDICVILLC
jgi:hypothetical protein